MTAIPTAPAATADPTKVMGRRVVAYVLDALLGAAVLFGVLGALGNYYERSADAEDNTEFCEVIDASAEFDGYCLAPPFGDRVYLLESNDYYLASAAGFGFGLFNHVVLQGLARFTVGKLLVGIRTVRPETGRRVGLGRALGRTVAWIVDGIPGIPIVGGITAATTDGHKRIGDMVAGTRVVARRALGSPVVTTAAAPPMGQPAWGASPAPGAPAGPADAGPPPPTGAPVPMAPPAGMPAPGATPPAAPDPTSAYPTVNAPAPPAEQPASDPASVWDAPAPPTWGSDDDAATARDVDQEAASAEGVEPDADGPDTESSDADASLDSPETGPAAEAAEEPEPGSVAPGEADVTAVDTPAVEEPGAEEPGAEEPAPQAPPPQWDPARNTYLQWEPVRGAWLQWDAGDERWKPIDTA